MESVFLDDGDGSLLPFLLLLFLVCLILFCSLTPPWGQRRDQLKLVNLIIFSHCWEQGRRTRGWLLMSFQKAESRHVLCMTMITSATSSPPPAQRTECWPLFVECCSALGVRASLRNPNSYSSPSAQLTQLLWGAGPDFLGREQPPSLYPRPFVHAGALPHYLLP